MSDSEKILAYLQEHGSITSWEAIQHFRCTRLSGRIYDLKRLGHNIVTTTEEGKNSDGDTCRYARYRLIQKEEESEGRTDSELGPAL